MLLTITLEPPAGSAIDATALSHLLRKHPAKVQSFELPVGQAHVFYPECSTERTTAALLMEVDPVGLVRNKRFRGDSGVLDYYVNDRPFVASSLMSVALGKVLRSAMTGVSETYPELAASPLPLRIELPVASARGRSGAGLAHRLFAPLGWHVEQRVIALDENYPQWGESQYSSLVLTGNIRLDLALRQLYVLLPVLDDSKHYWVSDDETEKLARQGEGWLGTHPERELITSRYLAHQKDLIALATTRMESAMAAVPTGVTNGSANSPAETTAPLRVQRALDVIAALKTNGAQRVVDAGCGPGALLRRLQADPFFTRIIGTDVSARSLEQAAAALFLEERTDAEQQRISLLHSSVVYRDARLEGFDAVVLMEVIEHVDPTRLPALQDAVFAGANPRLVVVTTPNVEYNVKYPDLEAGAMRHEDHRFEFSRAQFRQWAQATATDFGYTVEFQPVGPEDEHVGAPTQLAIFRKDQA
ncbi:3' terminal RNA ribose 2'-O-methyltransferase Hen1 [Glutamicibacter sp. NPDC087344]|uniref:3' terminal RNA ribose 2'-O-methyltransferase Hen1 n=1 Tax=Glutamicibacter sp. NPDC087344 TaxID=3363994 RepID=UPI0037F78A64